MDELRPVDVWEDTTQNTLGLSTPSLLVRPSLRHQEGINSPLPAENSTEGDHWHHATRTRTNSEGVLMKHYAKTQSKRSGHRRQKRTSKTPQWQQLCAAGDRAQAHGQSAKAQRYYHAALQAAQQRADIDGEAYCCNALAMFYCASSRVSEAEPLLLHALTIQEHSQGPGHPHRLILLQILTRCYTEQDRYGDAERVCRQRLAQIGRAHV